MEKIRSRACKHQSMLANLSSNRSLSFIVLIGGLVFSFPLQTKALTLFQLSRTRLLGMSQKFIRANHGL